MFKISHTIQDIYYGGELRSPGGSKVNSIHDLPDSSPSLLKAYQEEITELQIKLRRKTEAYNKLLKDKKKEKIYI